MNLLGLCSLALGLFQWLTITLGLQLWLGYHWSITLLMGLPLALIPLLGTAAAVYFALPVWHWTLLKACAVFIIPVAIIFTLTNILRKAAYRAQIAAKNG